MIDDARMARLEYAEQVGRQSLQMLMIAANMQDEAMRDELHAFAERMSAHAIWLSARLGSDEAGSACRRAMDAAANCP